VARQIGSPSFRSSSAHYLGAEPDPRDLLQPFPAAHTTKIRSQAESPCHSTTSRISQMRLGTRFDRWTTLRLKFTELAARSRAAKTRMNIDFSRQVETRRHVSIDARPLLMRRGKISLGKGTSPVTAE